MTKNIEVYLPLQLGIGVRELPKLIKTLFIKIIFKTI